MLKSYEAIYDHGYIRWLGEVPGFKRTRVVLVADDENELSDVVDKTVLQPNGARLVDILRATPAEISASISNKFADPVAWQREQRQDRRLPGREAEE